MAPRFFDSNLPEATEAADFKFGRAYQLTGRSLVLFTLGLGERPPRRRRNGLSAILDVSDRPVSGSIP
jgi:isoamylase